MITGMTTPAPNTSVVDGTRLYYEQFAAGVLAEQPDKPLPAFDDLTSEQARAWMLCYAGNIELSVRLADASLTMEWGSRT